MSGGDLVPQSDSNVCEEARRGQRETAGAVGYRLTLVDSNSEIVRNVILPHIEDRVAGLTTRSTCTCSSLRKAFAAFTAVPCLLNIVVHLERCLARDHLGVSVDGVQLLPILGGNGQQFAPNREEVVLVLEVEGDVLASVAEEMIRLRIDNG